MFEEKYSRYLSRSVTRFAEDEEIIAVIAAAIAAAESECLGAKFRVVSFKRK